MQGDSKHLLLAHLFDKPCFLGLLAVQVTLKVFFLTELLFTPHTLAFCDRNSIFFKSVVLQFQSNVDF